MNKEKMPPLHPGKILYEEFLKPMDLSQNQLALAIKVPPRRINEIVQGKRRISGHYDWQNFLICHPSSG